MNSRTLNFIAACAGMLLFGVTLITLGAIAIDLANRFSLSEKESGELFSILPIGIIAGSFIFGPVIDKYGYKTILITACLSMFAGFQGIAWSEEVSWLKWSIFFFGLGGGIINGSTNALVADLSTTHKGANLSILGIFFGLGALGMPLLLGLLQGKFSWEFIVSSVGWLTLAIALFYSFLSFPKGKTASQETFPRKQLLSPLLLCIAFMLFFQSSLEAIINNWTTLYLEKRNIMDEQSAKYALSLHILGMVIMRLLMGTLFRNTAPLKLMLWCILLIYTGVLLMESADSSIATTGLFISGAGLAGGFPIMLGVAGEKFPSISGKAFSLIFVVSLVGNTLVNYMMGIVAEKYHISHLTTVSYIEASGMLILLGLIFFNIIKTYQNK